jgi:sulfur carrier protein
MIITFNNRLEEVPDGPISVNDLIKFKNFTFKMLVTKVNDELVRKDQRDEVMVNEGDKVEVLHLISGG